MMPGPFSLTGKMGGATTPQGAPAPGASAIPGDLVLDPKSGLYFSSSTQNFYQQNPDGSFAVQKDPNVPSAVASFYGTANKNAEEAKPYEQDFRNVFGEQTGLAADLSHTIHDVNAPSVAQEQLAQTLQGNEAAQLGAASGIGGGNAFMARRNAANNVAALNAGAGQDAALLRAQEVAGAQGNLANVLGTQGTESTGMFGAKTGYGLDYNRLAAATKTGDLGNRTTQRGQNIKIGEDIATGLGSAGASAATISDPSLKTDVHEESPEEIDHFLSALQPSEYEYKGDEEGRERHGVMTTDLKKSAIGRDMIRETPEGEGYDQTDALAALFSSLADMHRRVKKVEGRRG